MSYFKMIPRLCSSTPAGLLVTGNGKKHLTLPAFLKKIILIGWSLGVPVTGTLAQPDSLKKQVVAHYGFEGNLNDLSGHLIHGQSRFTFEYREGIVGKAIYFSSEDRYFELPHNLARLDLREKAISLWFKPMHLRFDHNFLLDKMSESDYSLEINRKLGTFAFNYMVSSKFGNGLNYIRIDTTDWNFLVINREKDHFRFYLNGAYEGELKITDIHSELVTLHVGHKRPENEGFVHEQQSNGGYTGLLDELFFFDRPLNEKEILELYAYRGDVLKNIKPNQVFQLNNIRFKKDSYELREEAYPALNVLVRYLKENPDVKVKIVGHTDNRASPRHSKELSEQRAREVKKYLIGEGLRRRRIKTDGKGGTQPVADNLTEEGMKKNRRVEFLIY